MSAIPRLPDLPEIGIRDDDVGNGYFGTDRKDKHGNKYTHKGVDILAPPGIPVTSPGAGHQRPRRDAARQADLPAAARNPRFGAGLALHCVGPNPARVSRCKCSGIPSA